MSREEMWAMLHKLPKTETLTPGDLIMGRGQRPASLKFGYLVERDGEGDCETTGIIPYQWEPIVHFTYIFHDEFVCNLSEVARQSKLPEEMVAILCELGLAT